MQRFAQALGLEPVAGALRELTPMLITGEHGSSTAMRGKIGPGLEGELIHHLYANGSDRRESTVVLTRIPESTAYVPALVCRDREAGAAAPAQLPAERWAETKLESDAFNRRYRLLVLDGQDAGWVRELFSPTLVAWLATSASAGLSFEINEGNLAIALPGRLDDRAQLELLVAAAIELAARIRKEALEEEADPDWFDEGDELGAIERALPVVSWKRPPASVAEAVNAYRAVAARKPTVLAKAAFWALVAGALLGALAWLIFNPLEGVIAAVVVAAGVFGVARLVAASRYCWGTASVSRVGLEAWVREYARSRRLELRDRWRFHSEHRALAMPGFADHVLAGEIPGADVEGLFVLFGDAAEMRSEGVEVAYVTDRPLASNALVVDVKRPLAADVIGRVELPDEYRLETSETQLVVWRPITGNLLRTADGSDRFRARAGEVVRQVVYGTKLTR